ncbi:MAG: hypothetical protein JWO05_3603 [Gemmatimonadetes bacterium]|nr:hypothetical protein [Gemmatimonadota bacterium]
MKLAGTLALALSLAACSSATSVKVSLPAEQVSDVGALHLVVSDQAARVGVLWALPDVTTSAGTVHVQQTTYGSLCALAVAGVADVTGGVITLHVTYTERTALCTQEIRAISYKADISSIPPGSYQARVIVTNDAGTNVLVTRAVVVP